MDAPVPDYARAVGSETRRLRVGVARTPFFENLNPEVATAVEAAIDVVRTLTAGVRDVEVPAAGNVAASYHGRRICHSCGSEPQPFRTPVTR